MPPTKAKAKKMLAHGEVRGKPLTGPQKGYFGLLAGGGMLKIVNKTIPMALE
ncbi:hypothetical protein LCGC14_1761120, partial [marine sediment metagenome]